MSKQRHTCSIDTTMTVARRRVSEEEKVTLNDTITSSFERYLTFHSCRCSAATVAAGDNNDDALICGRRRHF